MNSEKKDKLIKNSSFENLIAKCSFIIKKNFIIPTNTIDLEDFNQINYKVNNNFYLRLLNKSFLSFILITKSGNKGKIEFKDNVYNLKSTLSGNFLIVINKKDDLLFEEFI